MVNNFKEKKIHMLKEINYKNNNAKENVINNNYKSNGATNLKI
jgi:hypothetical protein